METIKARQVTDRMAAKLWAYRIFRKMGLKKGAKYLAMAGCDFKDALAGAKLAGYNVRVIE